DGFPRRYAIIASLREQNGEIDHRIIKYPRRGFYLFEVKSDSNEFMKQIEIFERIEMGLIMGQILGIHVCRKSNPRSALVEHASKDNLPKWRRRREPPP